MGFINQKSVYIKGILVAITETWLKANRGKARDSQLEQKDGNGVSVRVSPLGNITFQLRSRFNKKAIRIDLGNYPDTTLAEARALARSHKSDLKKGIDPRIAKRVAARSVIDEFTVEALYRKWYENYCVQKKKNHIEILRSYEIYMFPVLGQRKLEEISMDEWENFFKSISKTKPGITVRLLTNTKQLVKWCVRKRHIQINNIGDISLTEDLHIELIPNDRFLNDDEIGLFLKCLENSRIAKKNKIFAMLCLIYGNRNGELRLAKKSDFDFEENIWTVPKKNHKIGKKTGKPLIRPITPVIKLILQEAMALNDGDYLFNKVGTDEQMRKSATPNISTNIIRWVKNNTSIEMEHWSIHSLRRTARTNWSTMTQPHVAEIMLGHKVPVILGTYDKHHYKYEQAACLIQWTDKLRSLGKGVFPN